MPELPAWLKIVEGGLDAAPGYLSGVATVGLKREGPDLALMLSERLAAAAMVGTTNRFAAAPVEVTARHLASGRAQAIVVNAGIANACTGPQGVLDAEEMCAVAGRALGLPKECVAVASTGLIGVPLPMDKIRQGIEAAAVAMGKNGAQAVRAMMTTDTMVKQVAVRYQARAGEVTLAGMAKGAGMMAPQMGTMLCFLFTDAALSAEALSLALRSAVDLSFNSITIDGDTSTNDMVVLLANGLAGGNSADEEEMQRFGAALRYLCTQLAKMIVADAEGGTKVIEVRVRGARNAREAKQAAMTVANSPLVKTAMFGADPNWGRIAAALGRSGAAFEPNRVTIRLNGTTVFQAGRGAAFDYQALHEELEAKEVLVLVELGSGGAESTVWTSDLTPQYVEFNAHYTT